MSNSLPDPLLDRLRNGEQSAVDALPDDNELENSGENDDEGNVDPTEIDFKQSIGEVYPTFTTFFCFLTTAVGAAVFWVGVLVFQGLLSTAQITAGNFPVSILYSYAAYAYFVVGLAISTGIATTVWFLFRASNTVRERLDTRPGALFLSTALFGALLYGLAALGGPILFILILIGLIIVLLLLLLGLLIAPFIFLAGLFTLDAEKIGVAIALFVVTIVGGFSVAFLDGWWPSGIAVETYMILCAYGLAILCSLIVPPATVGDELKEYLTARGEVAYLHAVLTSDISQLEADAPAEYTVDLNAEAYDLDQFETVEDARTSLKAALERVTLYTTHHENWDDATSFSDHDSTQTLALTVGRITHPDRCETDATARAAANLFQSVIELCREYDLSNDTADGIAPLLQQAEDVERTGRTKDADIEALQSLVYDVRDRIDRQQEYHEFAQRVDAVQSKLENVYGDTAPDLSAILLDQQPTDEAIPEKKWTKVAWYDDCADLADQVTELQSTYRESDLPDAIMAHFQTLATSEASRELNPYSDLLELASDALRLEASYGSPYDHAVQHLHSMHEDLHCHRAEVRKLTEVLDHAERIEQFLDTVDTSHPSIDLADWHTSIENAVTDIFPEGLRPITNRIEQMASGLWERADLFAFDWQEFESLIGSLYRDRGYEVEVTRDTQDEGVDVWARNNSETVAIQVKQNSKGNTVGRPVLQQIASTIAKGTADRVIIVTSSSFADTAIQYAESFGPKMELIDGNQLVAELSESNVPPPG